MLHHAAKFRMDRRLQQRRDWIPSEQWAKDIAALPDVSDKAEVIDSPQQMGPDGPAAAEADGK